VLQHANMFTSYIVRHDQGQQHANMFTSYIVRHDQGRRQGRAGAWPPNHAQFSLVPLISSYLSLEIK
jgi:hypothetical protein